MKRFKMLKNILRRTNAYKMLFGYLIILFLAATIIVMVEPSINKFGSSLWYCYTMAVTIGFGGIVVTTVLGKMISVILSLYTLLLIGMIPGIVVNYYMEIVKAKENETLGSFLDKLENLENLTKEELTDLSAKVRKRANKI